MASFQRIIDKIITDEKLGGTFASINNVTVCGHDQWDHDENLRRFMDAVNKYNLTLNNDKCSFGQNKINLLGYTVNNGLKAPDTERLKPLLELPVQNNIRTLRRTIDMITHNFTMDHLFLGEVTPINTSKYFSLVSLSSGNLRKTRAGYYNGRSICSTSSWKTTRLLLH